MHWRFGRKAKARLGRTAVALLMIANHVVIALGVPLPMPAAGSPLSAGEMFPCMNCLCGCRTAEHCWRHCCCYSMTQKLAWAKAHGVEPPAFVREAAEKEAKSAAAPATPEPKKCCPHCSQSARPTPPASRRRTARSSSFRPWNAKGLAAAGLLASLPALLPKAAAFAPMAPPLLETFLLRLRFFRKSFCSFPSRLPARRPDFHSRVERDFSPSVGGCVSRCARSGWSTRLLVVDSPGSAHLRLSAYPTRTADLLAYAVNSCKEGDERCLLAIDVSRCRTTLRRLYLGRVVGRGGHYRHPNRVAPAGRTGRAEDRRV